MSRKVKDEGSYTITADTEFLSEFSIEAQDHLAEIEEILLAASEPLSSADVDTIFRCVHSVKGAASFFNLIEIGETSHELENLLEAVRSGNATLDEELTSLIFGYIDLQKKLLSYAQAAASRDRILHKSGPSLNYLESLKAYVGKKVSHPATNDASASQVGTDSKESFSHIDALLQHPEESSADSPAKSFVKVDTVRLDKLVNSIGDMVIYSSMLVRTCRTLLSENETANNAAEQVERLGLELQDLGMAMYLDPIRALFNKAVRLVRDTSKKLDKQVRIELRGEETELDRTVMEELFDPIMHMIFNCIDHGIESAEERAQAGKPAEGLLELSAFHSGRNVCVQIKDDGRGLNPTTLREKAIEKGIILAEDKLSHEETLALIYVPGFSTSEELTDISGRGVGMDVVKNNVERMHGRILINSELGVGTTFTIEVPLSSNTWRQVILHELRNEE